MTFQPGTESQSAVPLAALSAVVLDTETTGLRSATDRIIEIGAVRLVDGKMDPGDLFSMLVNPGIPIPEASTEIHGLTDTDVADEVAFPDAMAEFAAWAGPAIILGYSIGFDVSVLAAEHARRGLPWRPPRTLDVQPLAKQAGVSPSDQSLEAVASALGIEVTDRHRAMGDAITTARVFQALAPRLQKAGIKTLAQAERVARRSAPADPGARTDLAQAPQRESASAAAEFVRIDSFPYRHTVRDLMSAPPLTITGTVPLKSALTVMMREKVSSLFLQPDSGDPWGIITERDVMRALDGEGPGALDMPAAAYGRRPLVTIGADEFVYRALTRMADGGFRHLGVIDGEGVLVGALSARDLLHQRAQSAVSLGDKIDRSRSAEELGRIWGDLSAVTNALVAEEVDARDIAAVISRELRALTRRACQLAEAEMAASGAGPPPIPYTMLVLGSGGRGESLLAMDQDNAIIFEAGEPGGAEDQWFARLGQRVSDILDGAGVSYCKGGIMGAKPEWRRDVAGWQREVRTWIDRASPEDILNTDIFFDAVPVYGEADLAYDLVTEARTLAKGAAPFLRALAQRASEFDVPLGWFGRFRTSAGRVDLKRGGLMPIFSAARVAALKLGVAERATPKRLAAANDAGVASAATLNTLDEAHRVLLDAILRQQLRDLSAGVQLSNSVEAGKLSGYQKQKLKWALEQVPLVRDLLDVPTLM